MKKTVMLAVFSVAAALFCLLLCGCYHPVREPVVKHGEFPFVLEYELSGEHHLVEDTIIYDFTGTVPDSPIFPKLTLWDCTTASGKDNGYYVLSDYGEGTPSLFDEERHLRRAAVYIDFAPCDYYFMGLIVDETLAPRIMYTEYYGADPDVENFQTLFPYPDKEQLEELLGIKLIRFEYSEPIENELIEVTNVH